MALSHKTARTSHHSRFSQLTLERKLVDKLAVTVCSGCLHRSTIIHNNNNLFNCCWRTLYKKI